ncbi:MAG: hypothetical protein K9G33_16090, partial [Sneathiella sp.]|nr:hypothetical protein [Sneathiella sp.]
GIYYAPLIVLGGFIMELMLHGAGPGFFLRIFKYIKAKGILYGFAAIFAVIVIGYKPYVTNVLDHGEFLHPPSADVMSYNVPNNIIPLSFPMRFFYGLFAETGESRWPFPIYSQVNLKIPGTFKLQEFKYLRYDARRGGFGPLFSLAFLASLLTFAATKILSRNTAAYSWGREGDGIAAFALVLLCASMAFPEPWWARYVPLLWLSVILFPLSTMYLSGEGKGIFFVRVLMGITLVSILGCIAAGVGGARRQNLWMYNNSFLFDKMKDFPVVDLYGKTDIRITPDFHSKSIGSAANVWMELLKLRGVNARIGDPNIKKALLCEHSGFLKADVYWCVPKA